jgi:hypothetical protein
MSNNYCKTTRTTILRVKTVKYLQSTRHDTSFKNGFRFKSQINEVHAFTFHSFKTDFNIIPPTMTRFSKCSTSFRTVHITTLSI